MSRDCHAAAYLTAPSTGVNFTGEMTCSLWFRADSFNNGYVFARARNSPGQNYDFGMYLTTTPSFGAFTGDGGFNATHITGGTPSVRRWTHYAFVVTGGNNRTLYGDGVVVATNSGGFTLSYAGGGLGFGGWSDGVNTCDAQLADVAVWNYAFSPGMVMDLYRGADPWQYLPGMLRGFWRLDGKSLEEDKSVFAAYATPAGASVQDSPVQPYDQSRLQPFGPPVFTAATFPLAGVPAVAN